MKQLLLLFILFPFILFGQARRKAIVDSIKAAKNLRDVSSVINRYPDTKVERMQVADSGEYVTLVVRVHIAGSIIASLPPQSLIAMKITDVVTATPRPVTLPHLPLIVEPVIVLEALEVIIRDVPVVKMNMTRLPPVPELVLTEAVPLLAATQFRINEVVARQIDTALLPPLPNFESETIEALLPAAAISFAVSTFTTHKLDTVEVPPFEEKKIPVKEMHLSANGYSLLEKMEGFSPELYALGDGGLTIGFGFFIPDGEGNKWDKGLTWEEAEIIMRQKVPAYEDQVKRYINVDLTQEEFDALTMMAYNLGGFSKATSIVNDINSDADFETLQRDWMKFVHSKAPGVMKGLMKRRKDELQVRNESDYQHERKIQILKHKK
jgi:GH24 family phage-related lysozyme (muramidase)